MNTRIMVQAQLTEQELDSMDAMWRGSEIRTDAAPGQYTATLKRCWVNKDRQRRLCLYWLFTFDSDGIQFEVFKTSLMHTQQSVAFLRSELKRIGIERQTFAATLHAIGDCVGSACTIEITDRQGDMATFRDVAVLSIETEVNRG